MQLPIYLDYAASTPIDEQVFKAMALFLSREGSLGNASSTTHHYGQKAAAAIELARDQVANFIKAKPSQLIWTSGATEANNLAIQGIMLANKNKHKHIITLATEHKSVLDPCRRLEQLGVRVSYLRPLKNGLIDLATLAATLQSDTILISIMHIHNEVGIIQDIEAIAKFAAANQVLLHVDAAQSVGKLPIDLNTTPIDLMSLSAHKLYGPKGIGALFIRDQQLTPIHPLILGGGQEQGVRSGTLATHQIVGMGEAYRLRELTMQEDWQHVSALRARLLKQLENIEEIYIQGDTTHCYPGIVNIAFKHVDNKRLLNALPDLALSAGSACTSSGLESSYVLRALGIEHLIAKGAIRFSFGRYSTAQEIDYAGERIRSAVNELRQQSSLWKMLKMTDQQ